MTLPPEQPSRATHLGVDPNACRSLLTFLNKVREGASSDDAFASVESEADLLETTAGRLNLRSIDFGAGGTVSW